jgi:hypothetical protein
MLPPSTPGSSGAIAGGIALIEPSGIQRRVRLAIEHAKLFWLVGPLNSAAALDVKSY